MKIMQVLTQSDGGPADHAADLAHELVRSGGHLVAVSAPAATRGGLSRVVDVHRSTLRIRSAFDVVGLIRLTREIRDWRPDVVHCQDRRGGLIGRLAATLARVPSVYTLHGAPDGLAHLVPNNARTGEQRKRDEFMYLTVERWLAQYSKSRVVVASQALREYATGAIGLDDDVVDVVPNGILLSDYEPAVQSGELTIVWLGLMVEIKRLDVLLEAVARSRSIPLVLVGDGPLRHDVMAHIERLDLSNVVSVAGFQSDPRPWLERAHIVALTSDAENCPLALLQAMASGCAVVATAVGGIPEIVRHEREGLLVPPGDPEAVSDALNRLRVDADLRMRLAQAAAARAAEYGVKEMAEGLTETYRKALATAVSSSGNRRT